MYNYKFNHRSKSVIALKNSMKIKLSHGFQFNFQVEKNYRYHYQIFVNLTKRKYFERSDNDNCCSNCFP